MALYKEPQADLRSKYGRYIQYGTLGSLALAIAAFTIPFEGSDSNVLMTEDMEIIEIEEIEQTVEVQPPPPPPPAPPPPQEVPDEVEIEETIIDDIELDFDDVPPPPPAPPAPPAPPPPTPNAPPPPPPPPAPPEPEDQIFEVVEQNPELIGGMEGLGSRLRYPEFARRANIEGTVFVQFVVDERGQVSEAVVLRSPNDALSEEALRVVRESRFTPGQQRGRPVKVRFTLPVRFTLR